MNPDFFCMSMATLTVVQGDEHFSGRFTPIT